MALPIKQGYSKVMTKSMQAYDGHHPVDYTRAWELEHEDMFGRGPGDPDMHGNPAEKEYRLEQQEIADLAAKRAASKARPTFEYPVEPTHWEGKRYPEWELKKMGEGDNHPDSPEKNWEPKDI